jgi:hypothetical protein
VVDAYGHVSVRHPDDPHRFLIARSLASELVGPDDIVELGLDGEPVRDPGGPIYLERFIHSDRSATAPLLPSLSSWVGSGTHFEASPPRPTRATAIFGTGQDGEGP